MKFRHLLITRFGLGQLKDDFFIINLAYLEKLLAESLKIQTSFEFNWIVLTDKRAPVWVQRRLERLASAVPGTFLVFHDPFENLRTMPNISEIVSNLGIRFGEYVVITRIDSDDSVSPRFVEEINDIIHGFLVRCGKLAISINPLHGIYYFPQSEKCLDVYKDNYSIQTIGCVFDDEFIHPYELSHKQISKYFIQNGLEAVFLDTEDPLWFRSLRKDSNVHQGERQPKVGLWTYVSIVGQRFFPILKLKRNTIIKRRVQFKEVLKWFPFLVYASKELRHLEASASVSSKVAEHEKSLRRWAYKEHILDLYIQSLKSDSLKLEDRKEYRQELISRYYYK